jgi:hypothetical protein
MRARAQSVAADAVTTFDADGTAHIKRAIPVPKTISPQAQALMASGDRWVPADGTKVISVQYRLAPQFPFPAAVEDSTAVYTAALRPMRRERSPSTKLPRVRSWRPKRRFKFGKTPNLCPRSSDSSPGMSISPATVTPDTSTARAASRISLR